MIPDPLPEVHLSDMAFTAMHWIDTWREKREGEAPTFDLEAPYQRGSVWTVDQRRNLIKSLLMGLPVGNIVVSKLPYTKISEPPFRIVDGKQRIEAIRAFHEDEFTIPGHWLKEHDLNDPSLREGHALYSDFSPRGQRILYSAHMGALEFSPGVVTTENVEFDKALVDPHRGRPIAGHEKDPRAQRWNHYTRTAEEIIQAEAELYLLVNFGGVEQTDADRERAEKIADGS